MKKIILILATLTLSVCGYSQANWNKIGDYGHIEFYKNLSTFKIENSSDAHVYVKYTAIVTNSAGDKIEIIKEEIIKPKSFISNTMPFFGDVNNFYFTSVSIKKI
jgi:hypothetical protein